MALPLVWTPDLSVGVEEIDDQHRELYRQVDRFVAAIAKRESREVLESMIGFLATYVVDHFQTEERWMLASGYPGYRSHKAEHDRFATDLGALKAACEAQGPSPGLALDLRRQAFDWLGEHIPRADMAMARWIQEHGTK